MRNDRKLTIDYRSILLNIRHIFFFVKNIIYPRLFVVLRFIINNNMFNSQIEWTKSWIEFSNTELASEATFLISDLIDHFDRSELITG